MNTTKDIPSCSATGQPVSLIMRSTPSWVELVQSGAARICNLLASSLEDQACDRADSVLYYLQRSDDPLLWEDGSSNVSAMLRGAHGILATSSATCDAAAAVRPVAMSLINELACAVEAFSEEEDLTRLAAFAEFSPVLGSSNAAKVLASADADRMVRSLAGAIGNALAAGIDAYQDWPARDHADRAFCILGRVSNPDIWPAVEDIDENDLSSMLEAARRELELDQEEINSTADQCLAGALHDGILTRFVCNRLADVIDAYDSGQASIDLLRRLCSFGGFMAMEAAAPSLSISVEPSSAPARPAPSSSTVSLVGEPAELLQQAIAVFQSAADSDPTSPSVRGLRDLAVACADRIADHEAASVGIDSLLGLMSAIDAERCGAQLFYAAKSLLVQAKSAIDARWEASEREAAHA